MKLFLFDRHDEAQRNEIIYQKLQCKFALELGTELGFWKS